MSFRSNPKRVRQSGSNQERLFVRLGCRCFLLLLRISSSRCCRRHRRRRRRLLGPSRFPPCSRLCVRLLLGSSNLRCRLRHCRLRRCRLRLSRLSRLRLLLCSQPRFLCRLCYRLFCLCLGLCLRRRASLLRRLHLQSSRLCRSCLRLCLRLRRGLSSQASCLRLLGSNNRCRLFLCRLRSLSQPRLLCRLCLSLRLSR